MSRRSVLLGGIALLTYAVLWAGFVENWPWLTALDDGTLRLFHDFGATRPGWITFWTAISAVFGPTGMRLIAAVGIIAAVLRRRWRIVGFLVVVVMLAGPLTAAAKALSDRPRPDTALALASSTSFPSGHALGAMVGVLTFVTLLWPRIPTRARLPVIVAGTLIVTTVGLSRIALNVHHPTDVIAGWALGYLWYLVCIRTVPPWLHSGSAARQQVSWGP